jgi:nucleoside-diphosphate-sugar epimerase
MNVLLPARVCERYRKSRILAFSTGNVYPLVPIDSGWSREVDELLPVGEYAMSALGRERMFEYASLKYGIPITIVRLNYAVEMRYGVVVDLARQVFDEEEIDVSTGYANVIWQADANSLALASFADAASPPFVVNVAGAELLDVRKTCESFGKLFGKPVKFRGEPASTALLNNGSMAHARYGPPRHGLEEIICWTADWLRRGGTTWQKPTHFEVRTGKF